MKRTTLLALICGFSLAAGAAAPPSAPAGKPAGPRPSPDGSRFLFIVDTSISMKPIADAERQALFDLVFSGVNGYMRTGDTLGIWTFADEAGIGRFPMQIWDGDNPIEVATRFTKFVKQQEYSGNNEFMELMPKLRGVIRTVTNLNVFILSDGDTGLVGTPVDHHINTQYSARAKERKTAKKPFVTTLVAEGGKITRGSVTLPGEPIELPARAAAKVSAKPAAPVLTNAPSPSATVTPTPAKLHSDAALAPAGDPPATSTAEPKAAAPQVAVETSATVKPAAEADPPREASEAPSKESAAAIPPSLRPKTFTFVTHSNPSPAKAGTDAATSTPHETVPRGTAATDPKTTATAVVSTSSPEPQPFVSTNASRSSSEAPAGSLSNATALAPATPVETKPSISLPPASIVVAARELPGSVVTTSSIPQNAIVVMQVPVQTSLGAMPTLAMGGILLALALFLLGIALRRMKPATQGSLITQSMHRR